MINRYLSTSGTLLFLFFSGAPQVIQGGFLTRLEPLVSKQVAIFLLGLFFGSGVVKDIELTGIFQRVGLSHVLSASGFNVSLVGWLLGMGRSGYLRWHKRVFILSGLVIYVWLAGSTPSVVRSACQLSYKILAQALGRVVHPILGVVIPSILVLCFFPHWLISISFWLSFGAGLGFSLEDDVFSSPKNLSVWGRIYSNLLEDFQATIKASLITVPLICLVFGEFSIIAFIANPLTLWTLRYWMLVTVLLLGMSFMQIPQITIPAEFAKMMLSNQLRILILLGNLPFSTLVLGRFRWVFGLSWILGLLFLVYLRKSREECSKKMRLRLRTNE